MGNTRVLPLSGRGVHVGAGVPGRRCALPWQSQRMECASAALALSTFAFAFSALFGSRWEWAQFPKSGGKPRALQTLARLRTHGSDAMTGSQRPGVEGPNDDDEAC